DVNVLDGFVPDIIPQISMHPGERGMQMRVQFREGAPVRLGERNKTGGMSDVHAA
ncbi:MAG: hypothetical protein JRF55_13610, partial [Deltaproteobacteria bacterium]|nr:hypothetical protein [Deltaproteobacteria bacterium]